MKDRKRKTVLPDQYPLIDPDRKIYAEKRNRPGITFWGLFQILCSEEIYSPPLISGFPGKQNKTRLCFAAQLFDGTCVDLQKNLFHGIRNQSTQDNLLAQAWHLTWKYKKTPQRFAQMVDVFYASPQLALDGVKRNLEHMIHSGQMDRSRTGDMVLYLLRTLFPQYMTDIVQSEVERSLAVLSLICLLGEDVVLEKKVLLTVQEWMKQGAAHHSRPSVRPFRHVGLYHIEDGQIDTRLLPDILYEGTLYTYQGRAGSPLRQIISQDGYPWLLLCGQVGAEGDSAVSGSGKTTSLRYLKQEEDTWTTLWLPLTEIYDRRSMQDPQNLKHYIRSRYHTELEELPDSAILLLDGLDELFSNEQLERLSDDLRQLQHSGRLILVVSSKHPWEKLPRVDTLFQWSSVWQMFRPCIIQNLTENQITQVMIQYDVRSSRTPILNTPYLLTLFLRTASPPEDPWTRRLLERWKIKHLFLDRNLTSEALFYRSLIIQIIRWSEAARGQELQWERDVFLLLHTLPAIACQMLRSESNDPALDPAAAVRIDRDYVARMIMAMRESTLPGLSQFPGHLSSNGGPGYRQILMGLTFETFLSGMVPTLFHGDWNGEDQYADPHFVNHSLRDDLACLHVANTFLLAWSGKLETSADSITAYGHTVEFMPPEQIRRAAVFFTLIAPYEALDSILRQGPKETVSPLSQFLAGHIGATMCERVSSLRHNDPRPWYASMVSAMERLEHYGDERIRTLVETRFGLAYISGQTVYAKLFRDLGAYDQASLCANQVFIFQSRHPEILNSDWYHMKAQILWDQVRTILNDTVRINEEDIKPVPSTEFELTQRLSSELEYLTADPESEHDILPELSPEQYTLLPIFSMMLRRAKLRWTAYSSHGFFGSPTLQFLCSASYLAKAYDMIAALSPGNSGMAYSLLGSLAANDSERLENHPRLPFFLRNPTLHLDIPDLHYPDRFGASFQIYLGIYRIRRGPQPYPARRLSELLLRRLVRLDQSGTLAPGYPDRPFSETELRFLAQAVMRAQLTGGNSAAYWRMRYLHELAIHSRDSSLYGPKMREAKQALQAIWKVCSCGEKLARLERSDPQLPDIISVLVILEDLLMNPLSSREERETRYCAIFDFLRRYRQQIQENPRFSIGLCPQYSDIQDCLYRIDCLRQEEDRFIVQDRMLQFDSRLPAIHK